MRALPGGASRAYTGARRYVAGETRDDALRAARGLVQQGLAVALDFFGEDERDPVVAARVADDYVELARAVVAIGGDTAIALDLSHLAVDTDPEAARDHLIRIARAAPVQVGAEDSARTDLILDCVTGARAAGADVSATLQANLLRSPADAARLAAAGVPVRLVKGAYVEPPSIAHPYGQATDRAFARLAHQIHAHGSGLTLGTHDPALRDALLPALPGVGLEHLLGVREDDARALAAGGRPVRIYVPYGGDWFRYWMRRVAESRGA